MTNEANGEWINGLDCQSAGLTRKQTRRHGEIDTAIEIAASTETDEEIRAEFDAAAAKQKQYRRGHEDTDATTLSYASAGATRRR